MASHIGICVAEDCIPDTDASLPVEVPTLAAALGISAYFDEFPSRVASIGHSPGLGADPPWELSYE